jgi:hypothetical protein
MALFFSSSGWKDGRQCQVIKRLFLLFFFPRSIKSKKYQKNKEFPAREHFPFFLAPSMVKEDQRSIPDWEIYKKKIKIWMLM